MSTPCIETTPLRSGERFRVSRVGVCVPMGPARRYVHGLHLSSDIALTVRADSVGRRPVLLAGALGLTISSIGFGLAKSVVAVLLFRSLGAFETFQHDEIHNLTATFVTAGVFAAATTIVHTVLADITDSSNQAVLFPLYGLIWPLGATIGFVYVHCQVHSYQYVTFL